MSSYDQLHILSRYILPEEIIDNFDIVGIEEKSDVLHIQLDEQLILPEGHSKDTISPNGFFPSSCFFDFPIRDRKVVLHIRRRRWLEKDTGKSLSRSLEIAACGTRYTESFAAFLKEVLGYTPHPD